MASYFFIWFYLSIPRHLPCEASSGVAQNIRTQILLHPARPRERGRQGGGGFDAPGGHDPRRMGDSGGRIKKENVTCYSQIDTSAPFGKPQNNFR